MWKLRGLSNLSLVVFSSGVSLDGNFGSQSTQLAFFLSGVS